MMELVLSPDHPAVRALGWALLHFVWQGAAIGGLAAVAMYCLRGRSPRARYGVGCAALLLMALAPLLTGIAAYEPAVTLPAGALPAGAGERATVLARLGEVAGQLRRTADWRGRLEEAFPSLVGLWLVGITVLSVRMAGGWGYARRLARRAVRPAGEAWQGRLDELARRVGVARPVRLLESALVRVPTVVGWARPVVLLPLAAVTGLTPRQLEAVLLHELAHVRRHDYLVNLVQSALEVLLFYHPGVWWVSERVREEREACCDDVAVAACGDALVYARALTELEGLRSAAPARLALAADGGSLLHRIRRLVLPAPQPAQGPAPWLFGALLLATLAAGATAQHGLARVEEEPSAGGMLTAPAAEDGVTPGTLLTEAGVAVGGGEDLPDVEVSVAGATVEPSDPVFPAVGGAGEVQGADTALAARVRRVAAEARSTEERVRVLLELAPRVTRSAVALDAYLDAAGSVGSAAGRRRLLSAVLGSAAPVQGAAGRRQEPAASGSPAPMLDQLDRVEAISSSSAKRKALSALLREQAQRPE